MIRIVVGSIVGGLVQFLVGFVFWGVPLLSRIPYTVAPDPQNAAVQTALAQNLTTTGTGTYMIPWAGSAAGSILHGRGPVALLFFNTNGFGQTSSSALIVGLILSVAAMLLLGVALNIVATRVTDFASRAKLVVLVGVATVLYFTLSVPVYNYYMPWGWWIYSAVAQLLGFVGGGLILARWFVPHAAPRVTTAGTVH